MTLKPLKVVIGGDTSQLDRALDRAGRNIKGFAIAAAGAAVAAAGGLAVLTRRGLESVDAMAKLSRSMDASINGLRAVQIAASEAGVSVADANTSMQMLSRELVRAEEAGTPAAKALAAIGLQARDLRGLDADERIAKIADRMKEMRLSAGQASAVLRDLGVRSREMSLLLIQGGDAIRGARDAVRDFGLEISQEQAAAIESANDAIARMGLVFDGLKQKLAVEVAPVLQDLADRFNALAKTSLRDAVDRVATAFGNLADVILRPEFIDGVAAAFEGLANFTAGAAEVFVTASQNVELLTTAFAGLSIAVAAAGGPLTLVAGLLGGALVGLSTIRRRAREASQGTDEASKSQRALNTVLATFAGTSAPEAGFQAVLTSDDNYALAKSALDAAKANVALLESELALQRANVSGLGMEGDAILDIQTQNILSDLEVARAELQTVQDLIADIEAGFGDAAPMTSTRPRTRPGDGGDEPPELDFGTGGADAMAARLEALQQGLMTERELLDTWREENLEALKNATDQELEAIGGVNAAKLRLEEEYQRRLAEIRSAEQSQTLSSYGTLFGNLATAFKAGGGKLLKISKAFSVAQGLINSYRAFTEVLADPSLIGRPFLRTALAGSTLAAGLAQVANIKSVSDSGTGGGGAVPAAGSTAAAPQQPGQNIVIDFQGDTFSKQGGIALIEQINDAIRDGGRIEGILAQ